MDDCDLTVTPGTVLFDMTTGYNGKFVLVGEFPAGLPPSDGVVSKSLDRRELAREFCDAAPSPKRPCMT